MHKHGDGNDDEPFAEIGVHAEGWPELRSELAVKPGSLTIAGICNSAGAVELLPTYLYPGPWSAAMVVMDAAPYEAIYKLKGKRYGLLVEERLNPAHDVDGGVAKTTGLLVNAKYFHDLTADLYHPNRYAHYIR